MKLGKVEIQVIDNGYTVSGSESLHGFGGYQECRMCFETIDQTLDFLRTQLISPTDQLKRGEELKAKFAQQNELKGCLDTPYGQAIAGGIARNPLR